MGGLVKGKLFLSILAGIVTVLFYGCFTSGAFIAANVTSVELAEPNFKIVATNVSGESQAGYLFGVTYSLSTITNTLALVRIDGTGQLYKEALEQLWQNYEKYNGSVAGKKLALVNVRYDADVLNLFVYTKVKYFIRADVVEFGAKE
jgi:hypothetical protein